MLRDGAGDRLHRIGAREGSPPGKRHLARGTVIAESSNGEQSLRELICTGRGTGYNCDTETRGDHVPDGFE